MSTQLRVGLRGGVSRTTQSRGRKLCVRVRAEEKNDFGTQLLKGLKNFGTTRISTNSNPKVGATISLKPGTGKIGGTGILNLPGTIGRAAAATRADPRTVFVAGATGRLGARAVRELLKAGYRVRAGARNVAAAKQSVDVAEAYGLLTAQDIRNLQIVELDLSKPDAIKAAIGPARKVVCALGAAESEALNFSQPKLVDGDYTKNLVNAAASVGVQQFVLVTSLGTGKVGWPASVLNLFGGVLYWKREAEKALESSGMPYTIVRPGGMERPTDSYKKTHRMILSTRDTKFGGQVSRLQVAELISSVIDNPELGANKVVEVTAETTAPVRSYEELLQGIKPDFSLEEQAANRDVLDAARQQVDAAEEKLEAARAALASVDGRVKELNERLKTAKSQEAEVKQKVAPVLKQGAAAEKAMDAARANLSKAQAREAAAKAVLDAARKAASQGQLLDKKQQKAVADQVLNPPAPGRAGSPALAVAAAGAGAAAAAKPLLGFLGGTQSVSVRSPSPAPAAAQKAEPAERATSPKPSGFNLGALLGAPVQVQEGEKAPQVPPKSASPPPRAAPAPVSGGTQKLQVQKPAAPAKPAEESKPAPAAKPAGGFNLGSLFKLAEPVQVQDGDKAPQVPAKETPAPAPAPAKPAAAAAPAKEAPKPAPPKPAAPAPAPPAPKAAAPPPPRAPPKPSVPVEDAAAVERRMLEALQEERRAAAMATAKKQLEAEAKAIESIKAAAQKEAQQKAPSRSPPPAPKPKPAPAQPAAPKAEAPAAQAAPAAKPAPAATAVAEKPVAKPAATAVAEKPAAKAAGVPDDAAIQAEKKKVQGWINAWQQKQASPEPEAKPVAKPEVKAEVKPAPAKKPAADGYDFEAAAKAKAEAQAWIAAWQAKQAANKK